MAISTASSLFNCPDFTFNSNSPSLSISTSVKYKRATVTAAYTTAERTATAKEPETIRSFRKDRKSCPSSLYDLLGVRIGADMREIKSAYRKLARVLHPDVGSLDSSADEFMKVHLAYTTLADPEKRAVYDRTLVPRLAGDSFPVRYAGGYKCRRWETDQCW